MPAVVNRGYWCRSERQQLIELARRRGIGNIRVFGSMARGDAVVTEPALHPALRERVLASCIAL